MQKTHVVMLLDESSSMLNHRNAVVDTFNQYTNELKGTKRCWISLFKFSGGTFGSEAYHSRSMEKRFATQGVRGDLNKIFENRKLKDIYPLTTSQYQPDGWTPLYDSIGELIQRTKNRLSKDAKVLFVIHTDGQENTSKHWNLERLKRLIQQVEKKRGWTFVYLGEGAEAWNAGYDFGIANVANFSSNQRGLVMDNLAVSTQCYAANTAVGGSAGSTVTFYQDAGVSADAIDEDDVSTYTSTVTNSDQQANT